MPRTIALISMLLLALTGLQSATHAASMNAQLREQVAQSVVQLRARGCPGGDRVGSGFAFGPDQYVVTALHVVAGCPRISVYWEKHGGATQQASIARVVTALIWPCCMRWAMIGPRVSGSRGCYLVGQNAADIVVCDGWLERLFAGWFSRGVGWR